MQNVVGGSYESDVRMAGCSVSMNLYAEEVEGNEGQYYTSALRSVDGESTANLGSDAPADGCRGLILASDGYVYGMFGSGLYKIGMDASGAYSCEKLCTISDSDASSRVSFAETGGINSHVVWVNGSDACLWSYPLYPSKDDALGVTYPVSYPTPVRVYVSEGQIQSATTFSEIEDENVVPAHVCCINGSIIIDDPEADTWYYTDAYMIGGTNSTRNIYVLDDEGNVQYEEDSSYEVLTEDVSLTSLDSTSGTAYLWLDRYSKPIYQTAEYSADKVTQMVVCGDYFYVFGAHSLQIYAQTTYTDAYGYSNMSFSSTGRSVRGIGCEIGDTVSTINGTCIFLGSSSDGARGVWYSQGSAPTRISTSAMEREWQGETMSGSYSLAWHENGHTFYALTVPSMDKTYVFDMATQQWHSRSTRSSKGRDCAWWPEYAVSLGNVTHLAGSGFAGLAYMDKDKFSDYLGNPIVKRRTCPILISDYSPFIINDIQLLWNTGTTTDRNDTTNSKNPVVMLEVSRDGGNTYGSAMFGRGGKTGQYGYRTIWRGIGRGTLMVLRFTISDMVKVVITGAKFAYSTLSRF